MKLLRHPAPPKIHGENLRAEIEAALGLDPFAVAVALVDREITVNVPDDADEPTVAGTVAAHTGLPTPEQQAEIDADAEADQAVRNLGPILAKCRDVLAGNSSFTNAQRDRLLAGLTLIVARRLR